MKKTRSVTPMGRLITRGEYVANVKANNQRIADVFMQYEERLRRLEAFLPAPALVPDSPTVPTDSEGGE